jgi:histidyl-tRNA synthetase
MGYGSTRGYVLAVIVGPDEAPRQVFNLRRLATRQEDKGLALSVLEDSVSSALEIIRSEGAAS